MTTEGIKTEARKNLDAVRVDKPDRDMWNDHIDSLRFIRTETLRHVLPDMKGSIKIMQKIREDVLRKMKQAPDQAEEECETCQG